MSGISLEEQVQITEWKNFIQKNIIPKDIDSKIISSWRRSKNLEIDPYRCKSCIVLSVYDMEEKLKEKQSIIEVIGSYMQNIYKVIKGKGYLLYLTDELGNLIHIVGDPVDMDAFRKQFNFRVGASWSEEAVGTTAVAIALNEMETVPYMSSAKYCLELKSTSCAAIPLKGADDELIGILGVAANFKKMDKHIFWILISAQMGIENQLRMQQQHKKLKVLSNYYRSIFDSISDPIITVDNSGIIRDLNEKALEIINDRSSNIIGKDVGEVIKFEPLLFHGCKAPGNDEFLTDRRNKNKKYVLKRQILKYDENNSSSGTVKVFEELKQANQSPVSKPQNKKEGFSFNNLIGKDESFLRVVEQARKASKSDSNILITGESGTGKELLAQSIHNESNRSSYSFVAVNCGAIPHELIESEFFGYEAGAFTGADKKGKAGKFEQANNGTLFLDEIGEMPRDLQVRLLRVLQNREVTRIGGTKPIPFNVRIIAATNKNISKEVELGNFRRDLFFRLNVISFHLPVLRQRRGDVALLARHFVQKHASSGQDSLSIDDNVQKIFNRYNWPGNVRELENAIEHALVFSEGNTIKVDDLPSQFTQNSTRKNKLGYETLREGEKSIILSALKESCNNISMASRILGISRNTLYKKIKNYNIKCS